MQGIIFVLHGRRHKITAANLAIVNQVGEDSGRPFAIGFLEGSAQRLEDAIESLRQQGVTDFVFQPVLLFAATHVLEDLPQRSAAVLTAAEGRRFLAPLGETKAVADFLTEAFSQKMATLPYPGLLIAHGTPHYLQPAEQLRNLAQELSQRLGRPVTAANHLGADPYQKVLLQYPEPLIVARLFLTEGYLAGKIKETVRQLHPYEDIFLPTLENTATLAQALKERLVAAGVSDFS